MRPALIAVDLDGTLLADDKSIPAANQAAVDRANELGIPFVISTGRPPRWLSAISGLRGAYPLVVACNGAAIYNLPDDELVWQAELDSAAVLAAVDALRAVVPGIKFGVENSFNFGCEAGSPIEQFDDWGAWSGSIAEIVAACQPIVKVLGFHRELESDELIRIAKPIVGDAMSLTHASMGEPFGLLELSAAAVSKATGVAQVCAQLGIPAAQVAAFGDMPNDLSMLHWAGSPFVMANSHPDVLAAGFPQIGSNNTGSVGVKILELLA
ncbi:MAG: Cof-type HAD-IIB family hydrolase [Propionibacteriaceae bacterium]|jgi:Cof subfamily protein (haloacid dehalogenase superfamily)|nr:Cof-type HAD-IIB family hydrolase [Propionibacteriaceae bacterium]